MSEQKEIKPSELTIEQLQAKAYQLIVEINNHQVAIQNIQRGIEILEAEMRKRSDMPTLEKKD